MATAVDDYVQRNLSREEDGWGHPRLRVRYTELRSEDPSLASGLRDEPARHLRALEGACHDLTSEERPGYDKEGESSPIQWLTGCPLGKPVGQQNQTRLQTNSIHTNIMQVFE